MIRLRVSTLPDEASRLLEVVAIAGRPINVQVARRAAEIEGDDQKFLSELRVNHLVRTVSIGEHIELEPFHGSISEMIDRHLPPETRRGRHRALATAMEAAGGADPQLLVAHFQRAGDSAKAGHYAVLAADQASAVLAFETAVRFYRLALDLSAEEDNGTQQIRVRLGEALSNAGRGGEAAAVYLAATQSRAPVSPRSCGAGLPTSSS